MQAQSVRVQTSHGSYENTQCEGWLFDVLLHFENLDLQLNFHKLFFNNFIPQT